MHKWVAQVAGGAIGAIITAIWGLLQYIHARYPMSPEAGILLSVVVLSMGYGAYLLADFLRKVHKKISALESPELGGDTVAWLSYRSQSLRSQRYKSLEEMIMAMMQEKIQFHLEVAHVTPPSGSGVGSQRDR